MALDLSSIQKAVNSLERSVKVASALIEGDVDTDLEEVLRAGVIQNFEFTYELCWKFMKRWLEENFGNTTVDGITMKELFRVAAENKLITNVESWFNYQRKRNITSHTYDADTAADVYASAIKFLVDAKEFLGRLEARND
jgi:nucleotidyltransferase substrate binding protein (TIGR01987 family)